MIEERSSINVCGKQLAYKLIKADLLESDKSLIVFLHEGLGSMKLWRSFPEKICSYLQLPGLMYDRYGYGESEAMIEERERDYMHGEAYDFLPDLLNKLSISKPVILLGHSDGASISLLHASAFPEKTKAVISIAAHVFVEDCTVKAVQKMKSLYESSLLRTKFGKYHGEKSDKVFYDWANLWTSDSFSDWNIVSDIKNLISPLLCIQGEDDEYGTEEQIIALKSSVKSECQSLIINDCGHSPHSEKEQDCIEAISRFLLSAEK